MKKTFKIGVRVDGEIQIYQYTTDSTELDVVRNEMKREFLGNVVNPILILVPDPV